MVKPISTQGASATLLANSLNKIADLFAKARNNPDYVGAVLASYGLMVAQALVQILLIPLYLHVLGDYRFGVLTIFMAQVVFGYTILSWPHGFLLRRFSENMAAGDAGGFSRFYIAGKLLLLGSSLLCAGGMLWLEAVHSVFFRDAPVALRGEIMTAMILAAVHFLLLCEIQIEQTILAAAKRQFAVNISMLVGLGVFTAGVVPWLLSGGGLVGVMVCFLANDLAMRAVVWWVRRSHPHFRLKISLIGIGSAIGQMLSGQGGKYLAYALIGISLQSDMLLIGLWGGPIMAAQYALVWKIAEMLIQLLARVPLHLQPEFVTMDVTGERDRLARIYREVWLWMAVGSCMAAVGYGLLGPWIVRLWVGSAKAPIDIYLYLLAGGAIFWISLSRLPATLAQSMAAMRGLLWVSGSELIAKFALILLLFPYVGLAAPLLAISLVHGLGGAVAYWLLGRKLVAPGGFNSG